MNGWHGIAVRALVVSLFFVMPGTLTARKAGDSLLDADPEVVYVREFTDRDIELLVVKPAPVLSTRTGGRKLGVLKVDTEVELIGFTDEVYKVRGTARHGGVSGWVSPKNLASKDKDFVANLKKVYERQKKVRELIANNEVAIGMSLDEVARSVGKPTKTKVRQTKTGDSGSWEFVDYEEQDHYRYVQDPQTGRVFRQFSHTTREERGKLMVEFEDGVVTAIEESENRSGTGQVKIVVPPIVFGW